MSLFQGLNTVCVHKVGQWTGVLKVSSFQGISLCVVLQLVYVCVCSMLYSTGRVVSNFIIQALQNQNLTVESY